MTALGVGMLLLALVPWPVLYGDAVCEVVNTRRQFGAQEDVYRLVADGLLLSARDLCRPPIPWLWLAWTAWWSLLGSLVLVTRP